MSLALDHLAVWTAERDRLVGRLSEISGHPALDGYAPEGRVAARGVRLAGGAFLDAHEAPPEGAGHVLLGLRGDIDAAERLATAQGWGFRAVRWREAGDGSPWSMLSFRRRQGLLSLLFVIDYAQEPEAWTSPVFDRPLYRAGSAPTSGTSLGRVWLQAVDVDAAGRTLEALGFTSAGAVSSAFPPGEGRLFRGDSGDLVLTPGPEDAIIRFDLDGPQPHSAEAFGERLTLVTGDPGRAASGAAAG